MDQTCYHESLKKVNDTIKRFTLKGVTRYAKVVSVYDGDTLDLIFCQSSTNMNPVRYKCRMSGYDAPELDEEPYGTRAKYYLARLCMGETVLTAKEFNKKKPWSSGCTPLENRLRKNEELVYAEFDREGKYGRPVVTLYQTALKGAQPPQPLGDSSINDMMRTFIKEL